MPKAFPVIVLKSDDPVLTEQLGSKPKFWFRLKDDEQRWLFKFAREGTGEHWAEKIAGEVANLLGLPAARVELADFMGKRGSASRSFVFKEQGWDLVHGDELLAGHVIGYDRDKVFRQSSHSLNNIVTAPGKVFPDPELLKPQLTRMAGFLVLDALIGNTDRHHQNWGVLRRVTGELLVEHEVAPTFDHASSLGRNEPEDNLLRRLKDNTVLNYARKGRGGIFWSAADPKGANPLDLVERAAVKWPVYFRPWLQKAGELDAASFLSIVNRVPKDWMSAIQKDFCLRFLSLTLSELKKLPR